MGSWETWLPALSADGLLPAAGVCLFFHKPPHSPLQDQAAEMRTTERHTRRGPCRVSGPCFPTCSFTLEHTRTVMMAQGLQPKGWGVEGWGVEISISACLNPFMAP